MDTLDRGDSISFLRQRTGSSDRAALAQLAEALGDLPLALEQAAAYLEATSTPPSEYVQLLDERASELFVLGQPSNYQQTIATTWSARTSWTLAPDHWYRRMSGRDGAAGGGQPVAGVSELPMLDHNGQRPIAITAQARCAVADGVPADRVARTGAVVYTPVWAISRPEFTAAAKVW